MIFVFIAGMICLFDLSVKSYIEKNINDNEKQHYFSGKLQIEKYHNKGMFLNFMEKLPDMVLGLSGFIIGIIAIIFAMLLQEKRKKMLKLGLSFILGGAVSNFLDRMQRGYVVDYFSCPKIKAIKNVIFNIADVFIFLGGIFIFLGTLFNGEE